MKSINLVETGKRIKYIRHNLSKKKTSLADFGAMLDPPAAKAVVGRWEQGANLPNTERLFQIAKIGNVSVDYLLYGKRINGYGEKIRDIRLSLHMTENDLALSLNTYPGAKHIHITADDIKEWEMENSIPTLEQLKDIAKLGETTVSEIIWDEKESNAILSEKKLDDLFDKQQLNEEQERLRNQSIPIFYDLKKILVEHSSENLFQILMNIDLLYNIKHLNPKATNKQLKHERDEILLIINKLLEDESLNLDK